MQTVTQHGRTAKDRFELVIRLQQSRGTQPSEAGLRLRAQALLKDILMSRLEVEAEINAHEYVHTQGFDDLGRALAASRALQVAFEGFRTVVPAARANLSVVLDSTAPDELAPAQGLSMEQKDLLDFAKPSQVLITQAFYDRIAHYQPALRTFPQRAGVYEFLWTSEQRLDELQAEAEFTPTLIQPPTATEAFDETVVVPVIKPPVPEPRWKAPDPTPAPLPVLDIDDEQPPARWLSTTKILAISGVVAVLLVVGYLVYSGVLGKSTKQVAESSPAQQQPVAPPPQATPPAKPDSNPRAASTSSAAKEKVAVQTPPPKPPKPSTEPAAGLSPQTTSPKPARGHNCSLDDGEIPSYLNLAERYRNSGKYESAIRNYNLVLGCQPGNKQAQAGLKTAEEMEKYSH
jgi:tetratricopeptide (TPR) repeat protein